MDQEEQRKKVAEELAQELANQALPYKVKGREWETALLVARRALKWVEECQLLPIEDALKASLRVLREKGFVVVKARRGDLSASSYLGCCSYAGGTDFIKNSGYYESMCEEALAALEELPEAKLTALRTAVQRMLKIDNQVGREPLDLDSLDAAEGPAQLVEFTAAWTALREMVK